MMPFPAFFLPALLGAGIGAATSRNPLQGALVGGAGAGLTSGLMGGLGGLGGASPGVTDAATGAVTHAIPDAQTVQYALPPIGESAEAASNAAQLVGKSPWETLGTAAQIAMQMGMFRDDPRMPAPSAGIPARPSDFTGLLSQRPQMSGAQMLLAQRQARRRM